jgi:magnesium chelatase family protein
MECTCPPILIQKERFGKMIHSSSQILPMVVKKFPKPDEGGHKLLETAINKFGLSARAYDRILKVGRIISDLEGSEHVRSHHISEPIHYRALDRASSQESGDRMSPTYLIKESLLKHHGAAKRN